MVLYDVIYADPPWRYSFSRSDSRAIESNYSTMSLDDICDLSIPSASDAVLYLWATAPKLLEALKVMESWGFVYKTHAVWDKPLLGMGFWFRGQHELLLVGVKGKYSPPVQSLRTSSMFRFKRGKHSAKPVQIREHISLWFPLARKLELFAREAHEGWHVWGNEVISDIGIDSVKNEGEPHLRIFP